MLRGADPQKVDVRKIGYLSWAHGESQATRGDVRGEQLCKPRFVEGHLTAAKRGHFRRVNVETEDLEARLGHRRGVRGAEVSSADDADSQGLVHVPKASRSRRNLGA
jgi:hypothetical protein